jgi:hypothetical protein
MTDDCANLIQESPCEWEAPEAMMREGVDRSAEFILDSVLDDPTIDRHHPRMIRHE